MKFKMKIKICATTDIVNNQSVKFDIPDEKFDREAFLIKRNDELLAYYNECPHIGIALDWDDNDFFNTDCSHLVCKNHGAEFVSETGDCVSGPCVGTTLKTISIKIEDNIIFAEV